MRSGLATVATAFFGVFRSAHAAYSLQDDYTGANFFSMFNFFTEDDPTHGYVDYVSQSKAQSAGLINTNNNQIYMGVDSSSVASGRGRQSVRITSKASYNHALILLDLEHMPGAICGAWPAFWTVGPDWPSSGEIDIIEGVNTQNHNSVALHTGPGCSIGQSSNKRAQAFLGSVKTPNCDVAAAGQATNAGCSIASSDSSTYGDGLNAVSGGVYATEWTSDAISVWFFPRNSIPSDINTSPDPSSWDTPMASFASTSCDIDSMFKDQQIVFDTTFCGDWAGQVWSTDKTCSSKASTCQSFVQNNPAAFADAYWTINSLKVFSSDGKQGTSPKPSQGAGSTKSAVPSATGVRPSVSGSRPVVSGIPSPTNGIPPIVSSKRPTGAPTTLATSMQAQPSSQWTRSWGGYTRSWGGNGQGYGGGWNRPPRDVVVEERNLPAPTPTWSHDIEPEFTGQVKERGISLPLPAVHPTHTPSGVDLNMVRRHMAVHEHGHGARYRNTL